VGLFASRALMKTLVADLPLAIRQRFAVARAIACEAKLVMMSCLSTALAAPRFKNWTFCIAGFRRYLRRAKSLCGMSGWVNLLR
jgi:ABC-type sugar transport system ATPase subunit